MGIIGRLWSVKGVVHDGDDQGLTPLMVALVAGAPMVNIIQMLLRAVANVDIADKQGQNTLGGARPVKAPTT